MTRNEAQSAGKNNQDKYEATVLDFLDKEMAAVQPAKKKDQTEELDALVSDLLKQVITEADKPQDANKLMFDDEDELFSGLKPEQTQMAENASTVPEPTVQKPAVSPVPPTPAPTASAAPAPAPIPVKASKSQKAAKAEAKVETAKKQTAAAKPELTQKPEAEPAKQEALFGAKQAKSSPAPADSKKKIQMIAAGVAGIVILGGAIMYFSSGSSKTTPAAQPAQSTAEQSAPAPAQTATAVTTPATPVATASKPDKGTVQPVASEKPNNQQQPVQQASKTSTVKGKPEPAPTPVIAHNTPAVQPPAPAAAQPVTPTPTPVQAPPPVVEKPAPTPVVEATPAPAPERKPTPPAPAPQVAEVKPPVSQPAPAASPAVQRNLVAAVPISQAGPVFPELAIRARASGSVVLELQIDEQGKVTKATPVSGPAIFHNAAVTAAMKWRYKPASIGGVNVRSQSKATMDFNLKR